MTDAAMEHTAAHPRFLAHHFTDIEQQFEAGTLGMWLFLITEIMFFGGLFATYAIYRLMYLSAFEAGSHLLDVKLGAINTAVLIGSSLTMALAVRAGQTGSRKALIVFLILTMLLGGVFLGVKAYEYHHKWETGLVPGFHWGPTEEVHLHPEAALPHVELFFCYYFFMTGLHALHMIIGFGIMAVLVWQAARGRFDGGYYSPIEVSGLYWHFVDIVWIFLFPLLYLIGGRY